VTISWDIVDGRWRSSKLAGALEMVTPLAVACVTPLDPPPPPWKRGGSVFVGLEEAGGALGALRLTLP